MNSYFVADGDQRRGPFTLDELTANVVPLRPDTLVWHRGMTDWAAASFIAELQTVVERVQDVPPPFAPASRVARIPSPESLPVGRWAVTYAVAINPVIWVLQRFANLTELMNERDDPRFNTIVLVYLFWALATFVTSALIYMGGKMASDLSQPRARLLRTGLGFSVGLSCLMVLVIVFHLGAASVTSAAAGASNNTSYGIVDAIAWTAIAMWLASVVTECTAWLKLGKMTVR